jgi:peptide chain release factor 1
MKKDRELLFTINKDHFKIERTKGSGKGGQNRNKRETAIRLTHKATGIQTYCADERSQDQNLKRAFKNLINKKEFKAWLKIETARHLRADNEIAKQVEAQLNAMVDADMQEENLKVEYF